MRWLALLLLCACGGEPRVVLFGDSIMVLYAGQLPEATSEAVGGTRVVDFPARPHPPADLVVENYGHNDVVEDLATFQAGLDVIAATYPRVLWVNAVPTTDPQWAARLADVMNPAIDAMPGDHADVYEYVLGYPDWPRHLPDGIHPDAELTAAIVRDVIRPHIAEAFR